MDIFIFATSIPVTQEKSNGEGYFLKNDGTYHAFLNYGCHGDFANGNYIIENNRIIFQNKLLNFKENNNKHIFEFNIEELPEKKRIFNGEEMIEYSKILNLDRNLSYIFTDVDSSPDTHKRFCFREKVLYINPVEIPCDPDYEYYRSKIIEFRKYFNLSELSNNELESLISFNKEKNFKDKCLFVFDLEERKFCAYYFYGLPRTIIEVTNNGERNLYTSYKQGYYYFDGDDENDNEKPEKVINLEEEYSKDELYFIMNFNPIDF